MDRRIGDAGRSPWGRGELIDGSLVACPMRARQEGHRGCSTVAHGQPEIAADLQCPRQRQHDKPVPKLIVPVLANVRIGHGPVTIEDRDSKQAVRQTTNCLRSREFGESYGPQTTEPDGMLRSTAISARMTAYIGQVEPCLRRSTMWRNNIIVP